MSTFIICGLLLQIRGFTLAKMVKKEKREIFELKFSNSDYEIFEIFFCKNGKMSDFF